VRARSAAHLPRPVLGRRADEPPCARGRAVDRRRGRSRRHDQNSRPSW
jgi:hypothetical protein